MSYGMAHGRSSLVLAALVLAALSPLLADETCRLEYHGQAPPGQEDTLVDCELARFEAARLGAYVVDGKGRIVGVGQPRFFARVADGSRRDALPLADQPLVVYGLGFVDETDRLAEASLEALDRVERALLEDATGVFEIGVHSEARGDAHYDELVTLMQAESLRDLLIERGIDARRLEARGYGSSQPLAQGPDAARFNRRVEIRRIDAGAAAASR